MKDVSNEDYTECTFYTQYTFSASLAVFYIVEQKVMNMPELLCVYFYTCRLRVELLICYEMSVKLILSQDNLNWFNPDFCVFT